MEQILKTQQDVTILYADWNTDALEPKSYGTEDMINVWTKFYALVKSHAERVRTVNDILKNEYQGLDMSTLVKQRDDLSASIQKRAEQMGGIQTALQKNQENRLQKEQTNRKASAFAEAFRKLAAEHCIQNQ